MSSKLNKKFPRIFIFDRFLDDVLSGRKKQTMVFGRADPAPPAGGRFVLVCRAGTRGVWPATGVCTRSDGITVYLCAAADHVEYDSGLLVIAPDDLEAFARAEGFGSWGGFRKFHIRGGRGNFHAVIVGWDEIETRRIAERETAAA